VSWDFTWRQAGVRVHLMDARQSACRGKHNGWDHALKVTAGGAGLVGHAGAVLLRKAADQARLTATTMSDIAVLAHLAPVLRDAPSGPTVRRALDLVGTPAVLDRIARARAKTRAHVWGLIAGAPAGFPWLAVAGKTLAGWLVIDLDACPARKYDPAGDLRFVPASRGVDVFVDQAAEDWFPADPPGVEVVVSEKRVVMCGLDAAASTPGSSFR
jgi:hypothetical protein